MKAKISEIFRSIQGEGPYVGLKQVFVRFYECNMHCVWCDTPASIGDNGGHYQEYTLAGLTRKVEALKEDCHSVSLTGGEPLLQNDFIQNFLPHLKKMKLKTYLETNGVFPHALAKIIDNIDIVAMDLKLPSSTKCRPYWQEHEEFLKIAIKKSVFIKTVISSDTSFDDIDQSAQLVAKINKDLVFILQPNYFEMKNGALKKCFEFQGYCAKYLNNVRLIPQVHKFMKLR